MVRLSSLTQDLSQQTTSLPITALIDSALCVGAGGSSGSLADKPIIRNHQGQLLIPGSQLKGRLRHECEKLARGLLWPICESPVAQTMCPQMGLPEGSPFRRADYQLPYQQFADGRPQHHCLICQLFGNPALPSRIGVDDLICEVEPVNLPEVLRPGVTLNRRRRTAEDQKLYFLETSPVNVQLPFTGFIHLEPDCPPQAQPLIWAALHHIHALGGSKSAGLGWLTWQLPEPTVTASDWDALREGAGS
ncbi:RAMP superfamily CRISPR-associated protein [Leptolyngbya sp. PCC 6406]|uniref:RAMP superfamily CRISPR-associated protein n=1 Tax=Leptolyngbya sp. PCC 6406 TaxID=1173264 RepID=UPI0002AC549B|nr:RAMP superfamily CRISPR-associated protein [Leptolyngbya sp. PCC 6406]